jgi:hypothetical protein
MYILYNTKLKRPLIHPRVGLWCSPDRKEADELLEACHEYVRAIGHEELIPDLVVRTATEVNPTSSLCEGT